MGTKLPLLAALTVGLFLVGAAGANAACRNEALASGDYVICVFDPAKDELRLFLNNADDAPFGDFDAVNAALAAKGEKLVFAMNAGMYHKDRSPVGLYVEDGEEKQQLSTREGPGNFHLLPNGIFWIDDSGAAQVTATNDFLTAVIPGRCEASGEEASADAMEPRDDGQCNGAPIKYATQSGPMLVIDGALHPKFLIDATSRKRRNGVGVARDGAVIFALADTPVTFREFAIAFRDVLKTPNALYLDGAISRVFAPDLDRHDRGLAMGPIVSVVASQD